LTQGHQQAQYSLPIKKETLIFKALRDQVLTPRKREDASEAKILIIPSYYVRITIISLA
jgi:hypothetical protein